MSIEIRTEIFNAGRELSRYREGMATKGRYGAMASFIGSLRDFNEDQNILHLTLEYYPGMTEKQLDGIVRDAMEKWRLLDALVLHRVGRINIGEDIVLVATWSAHRKEAFESCRMIMEQLKSTAPFWKKEETQSGARWLEKNTPGF